MRRIVEQTGGNRRREMSVPVEVFRYYHLQDLIPTVERMVSRDRDRVREFLSYYFEKYLSSLVSVSILDMEKVTDRFAKAYGTNLDEFLALNLTRLVEGSTWHGAMDELNRSFLKSLIPAYYGTCHSYLRFIVEVWFFERQYGTLFEQVREYGSHIPERGTELCFVFNQGGSADCLRLPYMEQVRESYVDRYVAGKAIVWSKHFSHPDTANRTVRLNRLVVPYLANTKHGYIISNEFFLAHIYEKLSYVRYSVYDDQGNEALTSPDPHIPSSSIPSIRS